MSNLLQKIGDRSATVVVVGAGYVGLPLAVEMAKAGLSVVAFDKQTAKVDAVNAGQSYIGDVPSSTLAPLVKSAHLRATGDPDVLASADAIVICVPTPLNKSKDPDNSYIIDAADTIASRLHPQQLVVLESTTFPGFTRETLLPKLSATGMQDGKDFFLAFSPERVDPGNPRFQTRNTPKVIGATTPAGLDCALALYRHFIDQMVPVSSTDTAEMVKLLENTFRAVNIGLVNEVAIMCQHLGLQTFEVIGAAATKPFGFMPFYPGPGLGGHCIPIDPLYLSWKLKTLKYQARFIELADQINTGMPAFVVQRVADALNDRGRAVKGSKVLLCGVTYKRDVDDVRESPALDLIDLLQRRGALVSYCDPYVETLTHAGQRLSRVNIDDAGGFDCVLIATDHSNVDYAKLCATAPLIIDTRNATKKVREDLSTPAETAAFRARVQTL